MEEIKLQVQLPASSKYLQDGGMNGLLVLSVCPQNSGNESKASRNKCKGLKTELVDPLPLKDESPRPLSSARECLGSLARIVSRGEPQNDAAFHGNERGGAWASFRMLELFTTISVKP